MSRHVPDDVISRFSDFLSQHIALRFPHERFSDLRRGLASATREFGFADEEECLRWLMQAPLSRHQVEVLASHLTIGETYFFREPKMFESLERQVFPPLLRARREAGHYLRIWSAGCATGEEPYSIAILLSRLLPDMERWNITILGTDINPDFLRRAREGEYGEWSFRSVPAALKERYFTRVAPNRYRISEALQDCVTFGYLNLADDVYPSLVNGTNAMDMIFCRNVLMYFGQGRQMEVAGKFHRSLVPGGLLVVSPTELSSTIFAPFADAHVPGGAFYLKQKTPDAGKSPERQAQVEAHGIKPSAPVLPARAAVMADRPTPPDPFVEAEAHYNGGRYTEAARSLQTVLEQAPNEVRALELMARVQANLGQLPEAREMCEKAIGENRLDAGLYFLLATILQEMGLPDQQDAALKQVLYLDHDFPLAYFARGNLALQHNRRREAVRHFENALAALAKMQRDEIVPHSEGITAGRMMEMIDTALKRKVQV